MGGPRDVMDGLALGDAEPLLPGVVKGPDEETQQGGAVRELEAEQGAGAGQGEVAAVEQD